ncbi:AGAP006374-PA-like protein [Anopheles sinensis]|uniref:AGAP006374-PA-like protein n=1 Tax=Anopheles sinensis TaxID=74873 RepID=A0A084WEI5_ANOSI|nr:AGAP006374-PA-like protein [Anopheles sinensis]
MSKTIETRLQSNEVRIPKKSTEFDLTASPAAPSQYFKSSFARSLSFSQGPGGPGGGPYGSAEQHFTRSLDFDVNFDPTGGGGGVGGGLSNLHQMTPSSASPVYEEEHEGGSSRAENGSDHELVSLNGMTGIEASNGGIVKTLWNYAKGQVSEKIKHQKYRKLHLESFTLSI